jgi:hypothetical protein
MRKSHIQKMPEFFDRYINQVDDLDIVEALSQSLDLFKQEKDKLEQLGQSVYEPGKWSIKDILQHIIDNERIQSYRALRFARGDKSLLPGYDEGPYAMNAKADGRELDELLMEFEMVRKGSIILYKSFDDHMLDREGVCFNKEISVLALGFVLVGHQLHHLKVIKEKYYPLLK